MHGAYFDCSVPKYCANCGAPILTGKHEHDDFNQGASFGCDCGTNFVSVNEGIDLSESKKSELNRYR